MVDRDPLLVDGSEGEGGGQVLRTSLTLSLLTGTPLRVTRIRAGRAKPGLRAQHLAAVQAAARVGAAQVEGARLGSQELTFRPGALQGGVHHLDVGTAGSATLVLQTVLPALLAADAPSRITVRGGTHNPLAPPWEFLERVYLPCLRAMGARLEARLLRHGFYPRGGGELALEVEPGPLRPLVLCERGPVQARRARVLLAGLPHHVARRELAAVERELGWAPHELELEALPSDQGPGNAVLLEVACESASELVAACGERGRPAEAVAGQAVVELRAWLAHTAPVGVHLSDQLIPLLALARGGRFRCALPLSGHAATQLELVPRFLPVRFAVRELPAGVGEVEVEPA